MKKNQGYMTRALQSADPRFADILGRLGYSAPEEPQEVAVARVPVSPAEPDTAKPARPPANRQTRKKAAK